jgi:hypothetical protein
MRYIVIVDDMSLRVVSTREVRFHPFALPVYTKVGDPGLMATSASCRISPKSFSLSHILLHVDSQFESSR